ncbi:(E)-beta-farnesene synthase [Dichanthelium oligosanthes]|uniref:(E)-beta-farnesene synthase n=1 Tax=Dichanthelium oligosanthes TaxID=888268 RepID=A0A1E5UZE3_9POAL|nr:(E)-beta-farnesene synthase [Dichanthelium oligosanthes]
MKERAHIKEEEVRQIILEIISSSNLVQKLELVDTLQWIGVDYHYKKEIDVFEKFIRDEQGSISSEDVSCLLMLYDAAHMRTHGEEILDGMITFNKSHVQCLMMKNLEPDLAEEVRCTHWRHLARFRRVERVEARRYISVYEKAVRCETILDFAKLDYNILQAIYCDELKELTIGNKLHVVSTVQTCMKQGVTAEQAYEKLRVTIEESWMDIIQEYLDQKRPMELLEKSVDVARSHEE